MKTKLLDIKYLVILTALQLAGCSTFQSATYNEPIIESKDIPQSRYADGIAFKHQGICVAVREGDSAEYLNLFVGPLIFPVFPLEIFAVGAEFPELTFYPIELDIIPLEKTEQITFDPTKAVLKLDDGTALTPYNLSSPQTISSHRSITLLFSKVNNTAQMSEFDLNGLYKQDTKLNIPKVKFKPRATHYRFLYSGPFIGGQYRNNVPVSHSLQHGGQAIPPKCNH